jgi:hypothetical protein
MWNGTLGDAEGDDEDDLSKGVVPAGAFLNGDPTLGILVKLWVMRM